MSTNQLSPERVQRSRNMQSDILHAVAEAKQVNVAKCLGVESSTVGRWLDAKNPESQVVRFCDILALCGLKIVPANAQCYDVEKIEMLFNVTKDYFKRLDGVDDFFQNDAGMYDANESVRYSRTSDLSNIKTYPNTILALLASFCEACKSLVAAKSNTNRPTVLVARLNIENEIKQERQDIVADDAAFWKTALILTNIVGLFILLTMTFRFWGL